jgi:hypothetical protein
VIRLLKRLAVDITPIRESREFRLLAIGQIGSSLGIQAALVALPFQIYVISHSAALVGLLGAFELGPMIVVSLVGGAIADRRDRRPVLALAQVGVIVVAAGLFALSLADHKPPVIAILLLGGLLAGCSALDGVALGSIIPGILGPDNLRPGLAFNYGMQQASGIVGPGVGGILIGVLGGASLLGGVSWIYGFAAVGCVGMLMAALASRRRHALRSGLRLGAARQPPWAGDDRDGSVMGRRDRLYGTGPVDRAGSHLVGGRRLGRRAQRRLPLDHQPDAHARPPVRAHEFGLQPCGHQRTAAWRYGVRPCGRTRGCAQLSPDRRDRVPGRGWRDRAGLPATRCV